MKALFPARPTLISTNKCLEANIKSFIPLIKSDRRILLFVVTLSYSVGFTMIASRKDENLFVISAISVVIFILVVSIVVNVQLVKYIKKQTEEIRRLSNTFVKTSYKQRATKTILMIMILSRVVYN